MYEDDLGYVKPLSNKDAWEEMQKGINNIFGAFDMELKAKKTKWMLFDSSRKAMRDPSTVSNNEDIAIRHISLDWTIDFDRKCIYGKALLKCEALKDTDKIILDGRELSIYNVTVGGTKVDYEIKNVEIFGQRIILKMGNVSKGSTKDVLIKYSTGEGQKASALQFIEKELTVDKLKPFLYSQCQPIYARTLLPCMDTPANKQTFNARVKVPKGMVCLLSALSTEQEKTKDGSTIYKFNQPIPIASNLLAIVVGTLERREISPRCAVWSEPSIVDKAKVEFEDTEKMLATAEKLFGEYAWTRYDLVVMPPSFPYGGMENPCLTFVTPTLIVGDRSLTSVVAHEIAHSWTGNFVTNRNWEHYWMNEGFTVFCERKILGKLYGDKMRQFENIIGWEDNLMPVIYEVFGPEHEYTKMIPNLDGVDPDDAFSCIPYEKGSAFLLYIEQQLNIGDRFEQFFREYFVNFAQKSILTDDWKDFLYSKLSDKKEILDEIDWEGWLYQPGLPPNKPKFVEALVKECRDLGDLWANDEITNIDVDQFNKMTSMQKVKVLDCLEKLSPLSYSRAEQLQNAFHFDQTCNSEIRCSWIKVALKAQWKPIIEPALQFVSDIGMVKYLKPIYKLVFKIDKILKITCLGDYLNGKKLMIELW
uniref:Peptidase M1 leukotriene A4 hydrolase/aminopeptidase C-terminal domain-containing protein n=1 Tax=Acrobeloides nanus TaxID=290746 RepID=A0A914DVL3_9BILA